MHLSINRRINTEASGTHESAISLLLRDLLYLGTYLKILYRQDRSIFSGIYVQYITASAVRDGEETVNLVWTKTNLLIKGG